MEKKSSEILSKENVVKEKRAVVVDLKRRLVDYEKLASESEQTMLRV